MKKIIAIALLALNLTSALFAGGPTPIPVPVQPPPTIPGSVKPSWLPLSRSLMRAEARHRWSRLYAFVWAPANSNQRNTWIEFDVTGMDETAIAARLAQEQYSFEVPFMDQEMKLQIMITDTNRTSLFQAERTTYPQWDQDEQSYTVGDDEFTLVLSSTFKITLPGGVYWLSVETPEQYVPGQGWVAQSSRDFWPDENGEIDYPTNLGFSRGKAVLHYGNGQDDAYDLETGRQTPMFAVKGKFPKVSIEGLVHVAVNAPVVTFRPQKKLDYTLIVPRTEKGTVSFYALDKKEVARGMWIRMAGSKDMDVFALQPGNWLNLELPVGDSEVGFIWDDSDYQLEKDSEAPKENVDAPYNPNCDPTGCG